MEAEVRFHEESRTNYSGSDLVFRKCFHSDLAGRDDDRSYSWRGLPWPLDGNQLSALPHKACPQPAPRVTRTGGRAWVVVCSWAKTPTACDNTFTPWFRCRMLMLFSSIKCYVVFSNNNFINGSTFQLCDVLLYLEALVEENVTSEFQCFCIWF